MKARPSIAVPIAVGVLAALALSVAVSAQRPAATPGEPIALVNASVVDVRAGRVATGQTVIVRDGRIASVAAGAPPAGVRTLDLKGRHVVPGLIDAHVHIATFPQMRAALESGVTTVRSAGVSAYADVGLRELVKKGHVAGPDMVAAGYHVRPMVAPEAFMTDPDLGDLMAIGIATPDALRRMVRANLAHGAEWIKVLATERAGTPDTDPRKQVYTEAELRAVVDEAATRGAPVLAHAHGAEGAHAAVKAGVRSIEHGSYLGDETLALMAQQGTFFVPTLDIMSDVATPGGDYDDAGLQRRGQMMMPVVQATIRRAVKAGVKIAAGSDTAYGAQSIARASREVVALAEAGLTPLQALQAATTVNADLLRMTKEVGAIEAGLQADLLVVDANPLEQPRTLLDPLLVVSNGRVALDRLTFARQ
jgi:imidazolonepropionase-like amidohydrolase